MVRSVCNARRGPINAPCCSKLIYTGKRGRWPSLPVLQVWLDLDRMLWSTASPLGVLPEPREGALAAIVGGRYMLVAGGAGTAAAHSTAHAATGAVAANASGAQEGNGVRRMADVHVLDMFTGPAWEQLDAGTWAANLPWLKQVRASIWMCSMALKHIHTPGCITRLAVRER